MDFCEFGRIKLFCGTITYSLNDMGEDYAITVKNIDTGEVCTVSGIRVTSSFASSLMAKMLNGSVTPATAYDVIRDALCSLSCQIQQEYLETYVL